MSGAPLPTITITKYPDGTIEKTIGVTLIGLFFNTYLYGLVTYQFLVYWKSGFTDALWIKFIVAFLFVIDTAHSAIAMYAGWEMCVKNFANPDQIAVVGWEVPMTAILESFVAIVCQAFLAWRILRLTKNWALFGVIMTLCSVGAVAGVIAGVRSWMVWEVANFGVLALNVIVWLGFQTGGDILITASLTFVLSTSRTGFAKTDHIINRLIRGAVQTGLFVSVFALGDLFSFLLHRDTNLYAMFAYPIGRIYTNTLLDTLNSRKTIVEGSNNVTSEGMSINSRLRFDHKTNNNTQASAISMNRIDVRTEVHTDDGTNQSAHGDAKYDHDGLFTHPSERNKSVLPV